MPRPPRTHIPGAIYHVISRGNRKAKIFLDWKDFFEFLGVLRVVRSDAGVQLYAFCLMPNHIHLLLGVLDVPLSRVMQRILSRYAQYFNRRLGTIGHVFQGRFKALACQKNEYFMRLIEYIHANPVRAGLVEQAGDWEWSSHSLIAAGSDPLGGITGRATTGLDPVDAASRLIAYERHRSRAVPDFEGLGETVSRQTGIPFSALMGRSRVREIVQARRLFVRIALSLGYPLSDVARRLDRHPSGLLYLIKD